MDAHTARLQSKTSEVILLGVRDPKSDLAKERAAATFNSQEMSVVLFGEERLQQLKRISTIMENDPILSKRGRFFIHGPERYKFGLKVVSRMIELERTMGLSPDDMAVMRHLWGEFVPLSLHTGMFLNTISGQGTDAQVEKWLGPAMNYELLGTYAQTELGHGTFLRGLETTATYDRSSQEFIIHSPTLTAAKWWPGGLGKTSTHAVVMARLFIDGKNYGPHPFMVQLRSMEDHQPLPGIRVGSIGPKMGLHSADNGYLLFEHVRIPRDHMLMKHSSVSPDGVYKRPPAAKASYATMVWVRTTMVSSASLALAHGLTIGVRYNAVRRQGLGAVAGVDGSTEPSLETAVLDYRTSQHALLPLIATAYALQFTGKFMWTVYNAAVSGAASGDYSALPELHATGAGLKALVTATVSEGLERIRKTLGGHGYSLLSGMPSLYMEYIPTCTYEGENTVMALQTARYLVKAVARVQKGETLGDQFNYIATPASSMVCTAATIDDFLDIDTLVGAFRHRAASLVQSAAHAVASAREGGLSQQVAWNEHSVDLVRASSAHCQLTIVRNFAAALSAEYPSPGIKAVLPTLFQLYALFNLQRQLGEFMEDGFLTPAQAALVRSAYSQVLPLLRRDAVALVDSFAISDYTLNSALGCFDGDVYNRLFEWAKEDPINDSSVPPGYEEFIKPLVNPRARL